MATAAVPLPVGLGNAREALAAATLPVPDLDGTKVAQVDPGPVGRVLEQDPDDGRCGPTGELPGGADVWGVLFEMLVAELAADRAERPAGTSVPKCVTQVARVLFDLGARGARCVVKGSTLARMLGHEVGRNDGHSESTTWEAIRWLRAHGFAGRTRRAFAAEGEYRQLANRYSLRVPVDGPARAIFERWLPARRAKASYRQRTAAEQAALERAMAPVAPQDETPQPGEGTADDDCPACTWSGRPTFSPDGRCRSCGFEPPPEPVADSPP